MGRLQVCGGREGVRWDGERNQGRVPGRALMQMDPSLTAPVPPRAASRNGALRGDIHEDNSLLEIDLVGKRPIATGPTDLVEYHVDPEMSDRDWSAAIRDIDGALAPGGICRLDISDLSHALHSEAFEALGRRWPERFARLSGEGFSFYRVHRRIFRCRRHVRTSSISHPGSAMAARTKERLTGSGASTKSAFVPS